MKTIDINISQAETRLLDDLMETGPNMEASFFVHPTKKRFYHVGTETGRFWNHKAMTFEHAEKRLKNILQVMDIPIFRQNLIESNLRWLGRNLGIKRTDREHPNYEEAKACLKTCLRHYEDLRKGKEDDE